jgi:hypothetical protein
MAPFVESENSALVLANRYDGIDLAHDSCRLIIFGGKPAGTNLQELFLLSRLNASKMLMDRIRTRFVQGVGRCCRSETDYCAVIIFGQELYQYCSRIDFVKSMSADLQAEIKFGLRNCELQDVEVDDFLYLIDQLLKRSREWKDADADIRKIAQKLEQIPDIKARLLSKIAKKEVKFTYQLWKKEFLSAINTAIEIADELSNSDDADGYRSPSSSLKVHPPAQIMSHGFPK